jgi:RPA family protein
VDPTGTSMIMAGSYQPEAMQQLARIEPPAFVAVVGKPNVYETPDGTFLITIRCESVTVVDKEIRDTWVLDAAERTLDRLDRYGTTPDSERAQKEYGIDPALFRKMVYDALAQMKL